MKGNKMALAVTVLAGLMLVIVLMAACAPKEEPVARYECEVYIEQGCAKMVVASGGELEVQSGATFDLQSGATTDFSGGVDLDGSTLTVDADADTTIKATSDDFITVTLGAAGGNAGILTGNFRVGNGTPGVTLNGEDAYIEGTLEVDGAATFDGGVDLNGATLTVDADADTTIKATSDDFITITVGAGTGNVGVVTGNFKIGNGTPDTTLNGEDAYVEGTLEVDGNANLDGELSVASYVYGRIDYIEKSADYSVTTAESGALFSNGGASGGITFTLPAAAEGLQYCFYISETQQVNLLPGSGDLVHHICNAATDRAQNTGTTGDSICVVAINDVYWVPLQEIGTWSDAD